MIAVDVLVEIGRCGPGKLANERTVVPARNGVVEALRIPVRAQRIPESRLHDVDAMFALHMLIVSCDRELLRSWRRLGMGE